MSIGAWIVLVLGISLTVAGVAWIWFHSNRPEDTATQEASTTPTTRSGEYYKGVDRPAGPDAETMHPDRLGGDHSRPSR